MPIAKLRQRVSACVLGLCALGASAIGHATTVMPHNLADLIGRSDTIVVGTIAKVSDGFDDKRIPYTEVTLNVAESIRGAGSKTISFRQYGLLAPRKIDRRTFLGAAPEGFPNWHEREQVMLFLGKPAKMTGLRTTVGLEQGKLHVRDGKLSNSLHNDGLFKDLKLSAKNLSRAQQDMLKSKSAAVEFDAFTGLVRRAVDENWIAKGVMRHAQ